SVERRLAYVLFILSDLHRFTAARARIAVAGDHNGLLSLPFPAQIVRSMKIRTPANCERSPDQAIWKWELKLRRHVTVCWHIAVDFQTDADFNQNWGRPGHAFLPFDVPEKNSVAGPGTAIPYDMRRLGAADRASGVIVA